MHIIRHDHFVEGAFVIQELARSDIAKAVGIQFAGEINLRHRQLPDAEFVIGIWISAADIGARFNRYSKDTAGRVRHGHDIGLDITGILAAIVAVRISRSDSGAARIRQSGVGEQDHYGNPDAILEAHFQGRYVRRNSKLIELAFAAFERALAHKIHRTNRAEIVGRDCALAGKHIAAAVRADARGIDRIQTFTCDRQVIGPGRDIRL